MKKLCLIIILIFLFSQGKSVTRWVATNGNDGNNGAYATPWLTFQYAADHMTGVDTVIFKNGTYNATTTNMVNITSGGSAGAYKVFGAESKWGVIFNGQGSASYQIGVNISNGASYIKFLNLAFTGFYVTGYNVNHAGYVSHDIIIEGNKIYDIGRYQTEDPYGITGIYVRRGSHHIKFTKNLVYNVGRTGPDTYRLNKDHAVYFGDGVGTDVAYDCEVSYNVMYSVSGSCVQIAANFSLVANNTYGFPNQNHGGTDPLVLSGGPFLTTLSADTGGENLTIANNLIIGLSDEPTQQFMVYGDPIGWVVKNNMIYGGRMWEPNTYNAGICGAAMYGGNYGRTDCENAEVNPLLVSAIRANLPSVDFSLQATSPAINAGADVGLTTDFLGISIEGLPDIGAYEYVSKVLWVATNGNDNNAGTYAAPYRTIQKAADVVNPGDSVIVRDGTYTSDGNVDLNINVILRRGGTAGNPVVFKSENKWGAKIDGSNEVTDDGWGFIFGNREYGNASYVTVENFEFKNIARGALYLTQGSTNITIRGNNINHVGNRCTDTDYGNVGIYAWTATDIVVEKNIFSDIGRYHPGENGCSLSTPYYMNHDHGVYTEQVTRCIIKNNLFYEHKSGWAVQISTIQGGSSSDISVLNNTFYGHNEHRVGQLLVYGSESNLLIANNIFYDSPTEGVNVHMSSYMTYTNCVVKNNLTYGGVTLLGPEADSGTITAGTPTGFTISNNIDNTDPLMVNPGTFNFALTSNSPAINAGVDVGLTVDYLGNPIIGNPDIGAYEYDSNPAPPQPSGTETYLSKNGKGVVLKGKGIYKKVD